VRVPCAGGGGSRARGKREREREWGEATRRVQQGRRAGRCRRRPATRARTPWKTRLLEVSCVRDVVARSRAAAKTGQRKTGQRKTGQRKTSQRGDRPGTCPRMEQASSRAPDSGHAASTGSPSRRHSGTRRRRRRRQRPGCRFRHAEARRKTAGWSSTRCLPKHGRKADSVSPEGE
jgi:hypothetical protein